MVPVTKLLSEHVASALHRPLPPPVEEKSMLHILDTVAAIVSGSNLPAGRLAIAYARANGGAGKATVFGSDFCANPVQAALANGISAHADETDDSHAPSLTHPGCAIVPAAIAAAEHFGRSGYELLQAVAVGYDVGTRVSMALGHSDFYYKGHHSTHSFGGIFGAAAAASALAGFDIERSAYALAYAVQLTSGNACWRRDPDHIEKAFDFGGMPAHNGMLSAFLVHSGFTGSGTPFEDEPGLFSAFPDHADPLLAVKGLGSEFEIIRTAIKKWSVGSPIQAALDSMEAILAEAPERRQGIDRIDVHLPAPAAPVVDDKPIANINLQQQIALMVLDGTVTFLSSHDSERLNETDFVDFRRKVRLIPRPDEEFMKFPRQAFVEVFYTDGSRRSRQTIHVRGTPGNPMEVAEVSRKALDLFRTTMNEKSASGIVEQFLSLSRLERVDELTAQIRSSAD